MSHWRFSFSDAIGVVAQSQNGSSTTSSSFEEDSMILARNPSGPLVGQSARSSSLSSRFTSSSMPPRGSSTADLGFRAGTPIFPDRARPWESPRYCFCRGSLPVVLGCGICEGSSSLSSSCCSEPVFVSDRIRASREDGFAQWRPSGEGSYSRQGSPLSPSLVRDPVSQPSRRESQITPSITTAFPVAGSGKSGTL